MQGQDFTTVTFGAKPGAKRPAGGGGGGGGGATTSAGLSAAKLDAETEELKREWAILQMRAVANWGGRGSGLDASPPKYLAGSAWGKSEHQRAPGALASVPH
eukprot:scaffold75296_cov22-Tisochrysis_lutea.AAC.1